MRGSSGMARGSGRPNVKLRSVYNPGLAAVALARPYGVYYLWDQTAEMPPVAWSYRLFTGFASARISALSPPLWSGRIQNRSGSIRQCCTRKSALDIYLSVVPYQVRGRETRCVVAGPTLGFG